MAPLLLTAKNKSSFTREKKHMSQRVGKVLYIEGRARDEKHLPKKLASAHTKKKRKEVLSGGSEPRGRSPHATRISPRRSQYPAKVRTSGVASRLATVARGHARRVHAVHMKLECASSSSVVVEMGCGWVTHTHSKQASKQSNDGRILNLNQRVCVCVCVRARTREKHANHATLTHTHHNAPRHTYGSQMAEGWMDG